MRQRTRMGRLTAAFIGATLVAAFAATAGPQAAASAAPARPVGFQAHPATRATVSGIPAPLTTSQCMAMFGIHCYSPLQLRVAYHLKPLYEAGITGRGRTIVIVDSFGSPTIRHDLRKFDEQYGLPPADLRIVQAGTIPPFDPNNADMVGWASETTLDVEYAHAVAPGAKIVLVETPVSQVQGVTGLPEMMAAEKKLIDQGIGDVISQSFVSTENTFPGFDQGDFSSLLDLRYAFKDAKRHNVTVLAASGDLGATNFTADAADVYPFPVVCWPSSDPLVTSVGGTALVLDDAGHRQQPDTVWNDVFGSTGGGVSQVFGRPSFQNGVRSLVGHQRGVPDISMTGAVDGGAFIYFSAVDPEGPWDLFGGTSLSSPMFAGIIALADQMAGHRLGYINPALYRLGAQSVRPHTHTGVVDVTTGDNTFAGVDGYQAGPGYDLTTGWGTIDAARFIPALIDAVEDSQ